MKWLISVAVALAAPVWGLEVNTASVSDLVEAGFSQREAQAIVSVREQQGAFASSADLLGVGGVTQGDLNRVRGNLTVAGEAVSTRSGTRPAVPGQRPAAPARKADDDAANHEATEHAAGDDHGTDAGKADDHGVDSGKDHDRGKSDDGGKDSDSGKGSDSGKSSESGKGGESGKGDSSKGSNG